MAYLKEIFAKQRALQERINGYALEDQSVVTRIANIKENVLACTDELHEALNETTWKSWTHGEASINEDALKKEIIDAAHFLINLALHAGMNEDEFFEHYMAKNKKNFQRQDDRYDGVAGKCPHCKRDFQDVGIRQLDDGGEFYCGGCQGGVTIDLVDADVVVQKLPSP